MKKEIIKKEFNGFELSYNSKNGYVNATQICKATGKNIGHYLENETTKIFLNTLATDVGIPISAIIEVRKGGNDKNNQGTWIHPLAAIHLAHWASADYALYVSKLVFEWENSRTTSNIFLQKVLLVQPNKHQKTFDDDFFEALCKIYRIKYDTTINTPSYFGRFINTYIYDYLFEGLPIELKNRRSEYAKKVETDSDYYRLHQFFEDNAKKELSKHISKITGILLSSYSIEHFKENFTRAFYKKNELYLNFINKN